MARREAAVGVPSAVVRVSRGPRSPGQPPPATCTPAPKVGLYSARSIARVVIVRRHRRRRSPSPWYHRVEWRAARRGKSRPRPVAPRIEPSAFRFALRPREIPRVAIVANSRRRRQRACVRCVRACEQRRGRGEAINSRETRIDRATATKTTRRRWRRRTTRRLTELARPAVRRKETTAGGRPFYRARCVTEKCVGQSR